jgi:hypothetical protein
MIPYPRPCLATTLPSQNRAPGGEPPWTSPAVEPTGSPPPPLSHAPRRYPPPLADAWARATPLLRGPTGSPARARWAEIPPPPPGPAS